MRGNRCFVIFIFTCILGAFMYFVFLPNLHFISGDNNSGSEELKLDYECIGSDCGLNEKCYFNPQKEIFNCDCKPGYRKNNEINSCVPSDCGKYPDQCHPDANCVISEDGNENECICKSGFQGDGINKCEQDYASCDGFHCKQNAFCNEKPRLSTSTCACSPGFYGSLGMYCSPKFTGNYLLFSSKEFTYRIRSSSIPFDSTNVVHQSEKNEEVLAIGYDCADGKIYLSEYNSSEIKESNFKIVRFPYGGGSDVETFMLDSGSAGGMAIDWISRNIFWTDMTAESIKVANMETKLKKVLITAAGKFPIGIAVHPYRGVFIRNTCIILSSFGGSGTCRKWKLIEKNKRSTITYDSCMKLKVFWSSVGDPAKLEWANEDGSDREIFLEDGKTLRFAKSLAIDWATDELCWTNAKRIPDFSTINCASIESKRIHIVVKTSDSFEFIPYGLAITLENYYWTDSETNKIGVMKKSTGEISFIPTLSNYTAWSIVATDDGCPNFSNACQYKNGGCLKNQICLPKGRNGRTCSCPMDDTAEFCNYF